MNELREYKAVHWNGNQVCSIDLETTGPDPQIHEIVQIAILPVDSFYRPMKGKMPFYVNMIPECPELLHPDVKRRGKIMEIMSKGFHSESVKELLYKWIEDLKLPTTKWGRPKQIYPLGHNYAHDRAFLMKWLGQETYEEFFGPRILDTMVVALYMNDRASFHSEQVPFSKVDLSWLARQFNIDIFGRHDALIDAKICADVYRNLCKKVIY